MSDALVVTSIGLVTPLGNEIETVWQRMLEGELGYGPIARFDASDLRESVAGEVDERSLMSRLPSRKFRRLPLHDRMIAAAAHSCLNGVGYDRARGSIDGSRVGIYLGTGRGPADCSADITDAVIAGNPGGVDPLKFQQSVLNAPLGHLSIHYQISGPCIAMSVGRCSALSALEMAVDALESGQIDLALVGAGDALCETYYRSMVDLRVLSPRDDHPPAVLPFDRRRNGIVLSEGSAFIAVEREDFARRRGAEIWAHLGAVATSSDGSSHYGNDPQGHGFDRCMSRALREAGCSASEVDLVLAGAAGEVQVDRAEALALARIWPKAGGAKETMPALMAPKGALGEMCAVCPMMAIILGAKMLREGIVLPTPVGIGAEIEDGPRLNAGPVSRDLNIALINEAAWGGLNASVVLRGIRGASV